MNYIKNLLTIIDNNLNNLNATYTKRINIDPLLNKLNFSNMLFASLHNLNESGISVANSYLKIDNIISVSKNAIVKKRNQDSTHEHLNSLNNIIINEFYNKVNGFIKPYNFCIAADKKSFIINNTSSIDKSLYVNYSGKRFIAIDGTIVDINKKLINDCDVKTSRSGNYGSMLLSNSYDVFNLLPINYHLTASADINKKKASETIGLLDQLHLFNNNDILIFDRFYFSYDLFNRLNRCDIGYIFRMKSNSNLFKNLRFCHSKLTIINNVII